MRCPVRRCSGRRIRRIRAAHAHGRSRRDARECVNGSTAKLVWLGTGPAAGLWLLQIMTMPSRTRSGTRNESSTSAPLPHADGASATAPRAGAPREARDGPRLDGHRPSSRQGLSQGGAQPNDGRRDGVARACLSFCLLLLPLPPPPPPSSSPSFSAIACVCLVAVNAYGTVNVCGPGLPV